MRRLYKRNEFFYKKYVFLACVFFLLSHLFFAQNQSLGEQEGAQTLSVKLVSAKNYATEDCGVVLEIPYTKSTEVSATIPALPQNATFVSMRLSDYVNFENNSGTKIELWLNFSEPGTYNLNPLNVTVKKRAYTVPFDTIEITENPKDILPILVVDFENGMSVSSHTVNASQKDSPLFSVPVSSCLRFTVSLQYAVQLVSLYWTAPKDSLFAEVERYEISQERVGDDVFFDVKIPIAQFEWQPLVRGEMPLPLLTVVATAYNGTQTELYMPECIIAVTEPLFQKDAVLHQPEYFSNAFSDASHDHNVMTRLSPSKADCKKIAELRTKERMDLPFSKMKNVRAEFEKSVGIGMADDEPVYFTRTIFVFLAVIFVILLVFSIIIKKVPNILVFLFSILVIVFFVFFLVSEKRLSAEYGIFTGGGLRSVPEEEVSAFESIESGTRVKIEHRTGNWLYISKGNAGGWTNKNAVMLIGEE